jgi:hypothetical protein
VLIFPTDNDGPFTCYKNAIANQHFNTTCDFSSVTQLLNVQSYSDALQTLLDNDMTKALIVVDNSPMPQGGAVSHADLTTMLSIRTNFQMNYNIKTLTIYAGLLIISLTFATCGVMYIYCKTRSDFLAKQRKLKAESDGQFGLAQ